MNWRYSDEEKPWNDIVDQKEIISFIRDSLRHSLGIHLTLAKYNEDYMSKGEIKRRKRLNKEAGFFLRKFED